MFQAIDLLLGKDGPNNLNALHTLLGLKMRWVVCSFDLRWVNVDYSAMLAEASHKLLWPLPHMIPIEVRQAQKSQRLFLHVFVFSFDKKLEGSYESRKVMLRYECV
jgi:hypothetical protein